MKECEIEMENHLIKILNEYYLRSGLINKLVINEKTFIFNEGISTEERWEYYGWVCKELRIKKIIRSHGMDSEKASIKKNDGHAMEKYFETFGLEVVRGTNKCDLLLDDKPYASLKSGKKIQWGMHVLNMLPEKFQLLFRDYVLSFQPNSEHYGKRTDVANKIISQLSNRELRFELLNYFFRKNEEVPYLIVKSNEIFYRIKYVDLINVLCDKIEFYTTKDKVKIVSRIVDNGKSNIIFEIETRSDKKNALLMHGQSKIIIDIVKKFKINVEETYQ